jgi:ABC-type sugar transport system ATPase subunit
LIEIRDLSIRQGAFALSGMNLRVPTGRYGVLMGATGCGKTSILEAIAGLRSIAGGHVLLGGREVTTLPPGQRGIGYVPQDGALFRTMTVYNHLAFALNLRGASRAAADERVRELAGWLGIKRLLTRRPAGLSGGEAQRVALGRALSFRPQFLLLDEPLSSLDEETRDAMIELLIGLRRDGSVTVLHVTHNRSEADRLADVRFRLVDGKLVAEGGS